MIITCECGNEMTFNNKDKRTGKENEITDDEGQYVTADATKFSFWQQHDVVGLACTHCDKAIWLFT